MLDNEGLKKAIHNLEIALSTYDDFQRTQPEYLVELIKMAVIKAFEYVYELTYYNLRQYGISQAANLDEAKNYGFVDVVRLSYKYGLISKDVAEWKIFRTSRGTTVHAYSGDLANRVFEIIPVFLNEAKYVSAQLDKLDDPIP